MFYYQCIDNLFYNKTYTTCEFYVSKMSNYVDNKNPDIFFVFGSVFGRELRS